MKRSIIISAIIVVALNAYCQTMIKISPTTEEKKRGVFLKFRDIDNDSYGFIELILKKNNTYRYVRGTDVTNRISEGKWKKSKDIIILESTFLQDNLPISVSCDGSGKFAEGSKIAVVENAKHELLTDIFVLVNNDAIRCLPLTGQCTGEFDRIERVKILCENGMASKWINVVGGERKVKITLLTDINISRYIIMDKVRFKIKGDTLKSVARLPE